MPRKWCEFLEKAGEKLALVNARRVFNENGGELDDIELLQNDDVLYVSDGGEFREPMRRALNGGVDDIVDVARAVALSELDGGNSSMRLSGVARCRTAPAWGWIGLLRWFTSANGFCPVCTLMGMAPCPMQQA